MGHQPVDGLWGKGCGFVGVDGLRNLRLGLAPFGLALEVKAEDGGRGASLSGVCVEVIPFVGEWGSLVPFFRQGGVGAQNGFGRRVGPGGAAGETAKGVSHRGPEGKAWVRSSPFSHVLSK